MFLIGELRDPRLRNEMESFLNKEAIQYEITQIDGTDSYNIFIANEADLAKAFDFYRAILGLPRQFEAEPEWVKIKSLPKGQITRVITYICVLIFLVRITSSNKQILDFLLISTEHQNLFAEIQRGELWRLWTPILLHFNFFHILFNMMWLKDLGNIFEFRYSKNFYLVFIVITGLFSNIGQYLVMGPSFGGMSGVVYGMLGFIWMNKKFNPEVDIMLPKNDVVLMIGWFILCMTGLLGPIANMAHGVGLTIGMLFGIFMGIKESKQLKTSTATLYFSVALLFSVISFIADYFRMGQKIYMQIHQML